MSNSPCRFNNNWSLDNRPTLNGFYERSMTKPKANNIDAYLEMIGDYLNTIEVVTTLGYPRCSAPFQWRATSVVFEGYEDRFEGLGFTPLTAVRNLYKNMSKEII